MPLSQKGREDKCLENAKRERGVDKTPLASPSPFTTKKIGVNLYTVRFLLAPFNPGSYAAAVPNSAVTASNKEQIPVSESMSWFCNRVRPVNAGKGKP